MLGEICLSPDADTLNFQRGVLNGTMVGAFVMSVCESGCCRDETRFESWLC